LDPNTSILAGFPAQDKGLWAMPQGNGRDNGKTGLPAGKTGLPAGKTGGALSWSSTHSHILPHPPGETVCPNPST
jgi:hypothetical protein